MRRKLTKPVHIILHTLILTKVQCIHLNVKGLVC